MSTDWSTKLQIIQLWLRTYYSSNIRASASLQPCSTLEGDRSLCINMYKLFKCECFSRKEVLLSGWWCESLWLIQTRLSQHFSPIDICQAHTQPPHMYFYIQPTKFTPNIVHTKLIPNPRPRCNASSPGPNCSSSKWVRQIWQCMLHIKRGVANITLVHLFIEHSHRSGRTCVAWGDHHT